MSASSSDLVRKATPNFATTLDGDMLEADTSASLSSVTGLATTTGITLTIDATDPITGVPTPDLKEVVTGVVSGSDVISMVRGLDGTTQQAHADGAIVVMDVNANLWNDFASALLTQHGQNGHHVGLTNTGGMTNTGGLTTDTLDVTEGLSAESINDPTAFSAYLETQYTGANLYQTMHLDTKLYDNGNNFSTSTYLYTAPVTGQYHFDAACLLTASSSPSSTIVAFNYTDTDTSAETLFFGNYAYSTTVTCGAGESIDIPMTAGDTISVKYFGSGGVIVGGGSLGEGISCHFNGHIVSSA